MTPVTSERSSGLDAPTNTDDADLSAVEAMLSDARAGFALAAEGTADTSAAALPGQDVVRVQLWQSGRCLAGGQASDPDRSTAVRNAAAEAAGTFEKQEDAALIDDSAYLVVEAVEMMEQIEPEGLSGLIASVQPGVHGLVLRDGDKAVGSWPSRRYSRERWGSSLDQELGHGRAAAWTAAADPRFRSSDLRRSQTIGSLHDAAEAHAAGDQAGPAPRPIWRHAGHGAPRGWDAR